MAPHPAQTIVLHLDRESASHGFEQRLAGENVWSDLPLTHDATPAELGRRLRPPRDQSFSPIYDGPGLLAGGVERIRSERGDAGGYRVTHEDGECFLVEAGGGTIRRLSTATEPFAFTHITRALGAPLALALALRDIYLLHASAIALGDGSVIALAGGVGRRQVDAGGRCGGGERAGTAGRTTAPPSPGSSAWPTISCRCGLGRSPAALPHFPQLKLRPFEQYPATLSPEVALRALVELEVASGCLAPEISREPPPAAIQALVRATVAAKLFDRELLARHFNACASAALVLPVYRLRYPHDLDRLGEALALLARLPDPT